jgi:phosphatidylglycerophosphate synthase
LNWPAALLVPDPALGWQGAERPLLGIPALVRVLLALHRGGIQEVFFLAGAESLIPLLQTHGGRKSLPDCVWLKVGDSAQYSPDSFLLVIRWGWLFSPQVLNWFRESLGGSPAAAVHTVTHEDVPFMVSVSAAEASGWPDDAASFSSPGFWKEPQPLALPRDLFCQSVETLCEADGDRKLLASVGKPTDRRHVVWVRTWSFPALRWLAQHRVTPNQITVLGFLVALLACLLLARGRYWQGVLGAFLLYASWVLDCLDGTLARLTFAESELGRNLDTLLGHLTNLLIFSSLIWAVYGRDSLWKTGVFAVFVLGGIALAHSMSQKEKALPRTPHHTSKHGRLQEILDKINHRDYAVVIFVLALLNGFKVFLWLSLVGVQVFWLIHLWLITRHRQGARSR